MSSEGNIPDYPTMIDPLNNEADWDLVARILEQFKKDTLYLNSNRREWTGKYPDHWAMVFE